MATASGQVSLLRGINVGGRNMVTMGRLRSVYEGLGLDHVQTHLQSGNVVFRSGRDPEAISLEAEAALLRDLGLRIRVLGRTHAQLRRVVRLNPFPEAEPARSFVYFLSRELSKGAIERLSSAASAGEEVVARGAELFVHYPAGIGRTRLSGALVERTGVVATARNWRTVTRLSELTAPPE